MRGVIRKAVKVNSLVWVLILSLFLFMIYVTFAIPVDAITRGELDELESELNAAEKSIITLDEELVEQRLLINNQTGEITSLQNILRETRAIENKNWNDTSTIIQKEKDVVTSQDLLEQYRERLFEILREKSDFIKLVKTLNLSITGTIIDTPPNYSNFYKKIGIELDNTIITMIKNDANPPLTYKNLITLDSSNTDVSGKFVTDDNGYFHRAEPPMTNSWRYYDFDAELRIFVDPPKGMGDKIRMITIQQNFDTYFDPIDMTVHDEFEIITGNMTETLGNQTRIVTFEIRNQTESFGTVLFHDRFVDKKCQNAVINADKIDILLADTINLMRNDCDRSHTSFEEREVIYKNTTDIDLSTSPNWLFQQEMKRISEFCIFKFRAC